MRACEGCRRRKIKCDAATTNSWPCAACVRLKLSCVPPTVNYTRSHSSTGSASGLERVLDFDSSDASGDEGYISHGSAHTTYRLGTGPNMSNPAGYTGPGSVVYSSSYDDKSPVHHMAYASITSAPMTTSPDSTYHHGLSHSVHMTNNPRTPWIRDGSPPANLHAALGELRIDETGVGGWHLGLDLSYNI